MKILQRIKVQLQFNIADKSKKQNTYLVQYYMLKNVFAAGCVHNAAFYFHRISFTPYIFE